MAEINAAYFDNVIDSINSAGSCAELQSIVTSSMAPIHSLTASITAELAKMNAMLALLTPPGANLAQIVTWITSFINGFLRPMVAPAVTYQIQLVELAAKVAELTAAISAAESRFTSCSITIPT